MTDDDVKALSYALDAYVKFHARYGDEATIDPETCEQAATALLTLATDLAAARAKIEMMQSAGLSITDALKAAEAQRDATQRKLDEAVGVMKDLLADAEARAASVRAGEDAEVAELCERVGYGAVMDAAMRLWLRKDPVGAFIVGPCAGAARAFLTSTQAGAKDDK